MRERERERERERRQTKTITRRFLTTLTGVIAEPDWVVDVSDRVIIFSPGFITWVQFVFFHFLLRQPSKIWCETSKIKNSETGVLGTRKQIGTGNAVVARVQFRKITRRFGDKLRKQGTGLDKQCLT